MIEQHSFKALVRIEKDIKHKVVLCAGKDAEAISKWAVKNGAARTIQIDNPIDIDENYKIPKGFEYVDTVIANVFFSDIKTVHIRRNFVGVMKHKSVDAWYVTVDDDKKLAQEVEATGEFGYLMTDTDFNKSFRMQLDDGII
jgi:spore germination protein YaaH